MLAITRSRLAAALVVALSALLCGGPAALASDGPRTRPDAEQPAAASTDPSDDETATGDETATDDEDTADEDTADPEATSCDDADVENPFARWGDDGDYVLGADFEDDLEDWTLDGGARAAAGNERFRVSDESDAGSLLLPRGASATSPPLCVSSDDGIARLFTRAGKAGRLKVEVLAVDAEGSRKVATLRGGRGGWRLSGRLPLAAGDAEQVALRFTAVRGTWRLDDLYVDAG